MVLLFSASGPAARHAAARTSAIAKNFIVLFYALAYPESMDRVIGVTAEKAGWIARLIYSVLRKRIGLVPKSKTLIAHHTPTLLASSWMDAINASANTVPPILKELAQLKVAMLAGCPF